MCLIIDRLPGVKVPFRMLEIACDINKHGFGLSFVGYSKKAKSNRLFDIKNVDPKKDNDPDEVMKLLERYESKRVILHLRHSTVGEVNRENAHPFFPLLHDSDGVDMGFCHNGTLWEWKPEDTKISDSRYFSNALIRPLAQRIAKYSGVDKILHDALFQMLMKKYAGVSSIFVCFDNFGNVVKFNEQIGEQHDGWWASNKYSFNTYHPRTTKTRPAVGNYSSAIGDESGIGVEDEWDSYGGYGSSAISPPAATHTFRGDASKALPWERQNKKPPAPIQQAFWELELEKQDRLREATAVIPLRHTEVRLKYEMEKLEREFLFTVLTPESIMPAGNGVIGGKVLTVDRRKFVDQAGLKSIYDVGNLTKVQLTELCKDYPQAMTELIIDLFTMIPKAQDSMPPSDTINTDIIGG